MPFQPLLLFLRGYFGSSFDFERLSQGTVVLCSFAQLVVRVYGIWSTREAIQPSVYHGP